MLVRPNLSFGEILHETWRPLAVFFVLDLLVTIAYVGLGWTWITPNSIPLPLLGTGLAVYLGLRNNAAYARWWEARTLWGAVVNHSRSLARSLSAMMTNPASQQARHRIIQHQIAFVHALRMSLRREDVPRKLRRFLSDADLDAVKCATNVPFALHIRMAEMVGEELRANRIDSIEATAINDIMSDLSNAQGGLERIRNTPMPRQYSALPGVFVSIYCLALPFGFVPELNLLTPLGSAVIGLMFLTLDMSGRHLEDPFSRSTHEIPMTAITRTIEIDLKQTLGDENRPAPLRPVFGVLT
ncbi:bestrophin family ion channel [Lichenihabitans sp. Uapishka_5]|uniref:bestrophin family protein n=1 Tax=Lichenihabitans sp. Uapishka_5 TaxID=3037302 RepID=UPI0029E7EF35|nr:bestrophin family ion channel [Lichenihabitans sp. Uapishka_5]MDX7950985.1 bestrophin family ion channel [Lichenihabitans sp. Uapishka_5]